MNFCEFNLSEYSFLQFSRKNIFSIDGLRKKSRPMGFYFISYRSFPDFTGNEPVSLQESISPEPGTVILLFARNQRNQQHENDIHFPGYSVW